jgi:hypothetical protein
MVNIAGCNTKCLLQLQGRLRYSTTHPVPRLCACSQQSSIATTVPLCLTNGAVTHTPAFKHIT